MIESNVNSIVDLYLLGLVVISAIISLSIQLIGLLKSEIGKI